VRTHTNTHERTRFSLSLSLSLSAHVCCVYTIVFCIHVYACFHARVLASYTQANANTHMHAHTCMHAHTHIHTHTHMHTCKQDAAVYMHAPGRHTYLCTHAHTYIHTYNQKRGLIERQMRRWRWQLPGRCEKASLQREYLWQSVLLQ
jgi:hypothetical protein